MIDRSQNLADMKQKISDFIKIRGPSLPIHLSKETKTSLLLASAFLADMVSEKTLKISHLKVGGSPLYYLPGQEYRLESFYNHLPGKEREAFEKLRTSKVLKDEEQEPAVRIALRSIKDFAIPFTVKFQDKSIVFWQYHSVSEEEARNLISESLEKITKKEEPIEIKEKPKAERIEEQKMEEIKKDILAIETKDIEKKILPIFSEEKSAEKKAKREKQKPDRFLEEVKSFLSSKSIELLKVEKFSKKEVLARIKHQNDEILLFAFDKKRVSEDEILKAWKKSSSLNLKYSILIRDELSKKTKETIEAFRNMHYIDRI